MQEKISELEGIVGYKVDVERDGLEGVQLFKVLDAYLNGITVKSNEKNKDTYRRACASEYIRNQRYIAPKSDTYDGCIEIPFENTTIPVPYGYDGLLRQLFRSYITPVRVFGGHMYPSYDSLRNPLRDEYGFELLTYHFDEEEYKRIISERHTKRSLDEVIRDQVALFKEAHEYIHAVTDSGDKSRYQEVCDLLGQCQELAVNLGHMIEVRAKEPEEVIHILEQYCEVVFGLYDGISNGTDITEQLKLMDECEKNFFGDAFERLSEKKEVVFLVDRAKNWNSLHTIWKAASEDDDTQVVVIAVPYAYKDEFGMIPENLWETDADRLPDEVELTPYDEYDFCLHSPDMVVYQNPYDAYSDGISVHPMFYAENMCKYTDNMVFIPPFILDEIIPEDFRGRYTLGTFARNPGLVYADKIIVQSEAMAEVYAELLSEMTGDVIDWKTRIIGIGSGMKDYDATCKKLAFNIRRSMSKNPRILFYIGASMLYDNGLPALEKKRAIFEHLTKREYEEEKFTVDIYRDPYAEEILQNTRPEVYEAYVEWLDGAKNKVVSGADIDVKELADKYDAFYGDGGVLLNEFVTKEKPYIWENPEATYMEEDMSGFLVNVKEAMKEPEVTKDGEMIWKSICVEGG